MFGIWTSPETVVIKENKMCSCGCNDKNCSQVTAYKDSKGCLHGSKEKCSEANDRYKDEELKGSVRKVLSHFIRFGGNNANNNHYNSYEMYRNSGKNEAFEELVKNWRLLRKLLNEVELS